MLFGSPFALGYALNVCWLTNWRVTSIVAMLISGFLSLFMLFGVVSAACFFLPGLRYHRQRLREKKRLRADGPESGASASEIAL